MIFTFVFENYQNSLLPGLPFDLFWSEFWRWKLWDQNFVPFISGNIHIKDSKKPGFIVSIELRTKFDWFHGLSLKVSKEISKTDWKYSWGFQKKFQMSKLKTKSTSPVKRLVKRKHSRPLMLGEFDELVQWLLKATRCKVNTLVITFTASATQQRAWQHCYPRLNKSRTDVKDPWAKSLLQATEFIKHCATTGKVELRAGAVNLVRNIISHQG